MSKISVTCPECKNERMIENKDFNHSIADLCRKCNGRKTIIANADMDKWQKKNAHFIGQEFNKIKINKIYSLKNKSNKSITYVDGICLCGNLISKVVFGNIKRGNTRSCGKC